MKIAVVSDIHGNLHALEAVMADISQYQVDEIWCLGDIVGYGAFPSECIEVVKENCSIVLAGNHDLAACGKVSLDEFNLEAREAVEWTQERLSKEEIKFLQMLEPAQKIEAEGIKAVLTHGSPLNPVWEYVLSSYDVERVFYYLEENGLQLCFLGHSHIQFFSSSLMLPPELLRSEDRLDFERNELAVINPGSVGQPRDYDPRAAFCLIEFKGGKTSIQFRRVEYDVEAASGAIVDAGLPVFLAARLRSGY